MDLMQDTSKTYLYAAGGTAAPTANTEGDTVTTVSYTHLVVQQAAVFTAEGNALGHTLVNDVGGDFRQTVDTVSYTHLDVYKRQVVLRAFLGSHRPRVLTRGEHAPCRIPGEMCIRDRCRPSTIARIRWFPAAAMTWRRGW